jgi:hypothetical protein
MESPKETYKKLQSIDNIEQVAYERLFEIYLNRNISGDKKRIDIESTDQETLINRAFKQPLPGFIYTFIHVNNAALQEIQNFKTGKVVKFHDLTPILFCTSFDTSKKIMKGLNLNILPRGERLKFLQAFWEYYKEFFVKVEETTENGIFTINLDYLNIALGGKNPELYEYFNRSQNALFNYAYRSYDLKNIQRFRILEFEEWKYIPFFDAKQSFKKANLEQIYRTYWDNKNKT